VGRNTVWRESTGLWKRVRRSLVRIIGKGVAHEDEIRDPLRKPVVLEKSLKEGQLTMRHVRHRVSAGRVILRFSLERGASESTIINLLLNSVRTDSTTYPA
jgi:hypothetical protein